MKIIIMAAGKGDRFGITVKPKCFSKIQGVPNIERTISLIKNGGTSNNIRPYCTTTQRNAKWFEDLDCEIIIGYNSLETQRFSNAFPLESQTVFLYGDVVYNELDLERILYGTDRTTFYGRYEGNPLTGKPYGELLGINVVDFEKFERAVADTNKLYATKVLKRAIGWEVYRVREGLDPTWNTPTNANFVELSYMTDDFDDRKELRNLCKLYGTKNRT